MSWRNNIFEVNGRYVVKKTITCGSWVFKEGDILRFLRDYYSFHDEASFYEFQNELDNQLKYWILDDEDPVYKWQEFFERARP
jgi:hypothetical protein